jgi:hypothetical protein
MKTVKRIVNGYWDLILVIAWFILIFSIAIAIT